MSGPFRRLSENALKRFAGRIRVVNTTGSIVAAMNVLRSFAVDTLKRSGTTVEDIGTMNAAGPAGIGMTTIAGAVVATMMIADGAAAIATMTTTIDG